MLLREVFVNLFLLYAYFLNQLFEFNIFAFDLLIHHGLQPSSQGISLFLLLKFQNFQLFFSMILPLAILLYREPIPLLLQGLASQFCLLILLTHTQLLQLVSEVNYFLRFFIHKALVMLIGLAFQLFHFIRVLILQLELDLSSLFNNLRQVAFPFFLELAQNLGLLIIKAVHLNRPTITMCSIIVCFRWLKCLILQFLRQFIWSCSLCAFFKSTTSALQLYSSSRYSIRVQTLSSPYFSIKQAFSQLSRLRLPFIRQQLFQFSRTINFIHLQKNSQLSQLPNIDELGGLSRKQNRKQLQQCEYNTEINQLTTMSIRPLCKITFSLSQQQQDTKQSHNQRQAVDFIEVFPGTSTRELTELVGDKLGCGYQQLIQKEIKSQLLNILNAGSRTNCDLGQQQVWRSEMQKVLGEESALNTSSKISPQISERNLKNKYFSTNYDKILKSKSEKMLTCGNKQNNHNIYERGIAKKKETEHKISMMKKSKQVEEVVECTFTPNIKETVQFFKKNRPTFFNQEEKSKESTFQRLYKQSFDIKQKRNKRLRTLQNQQEAKISKLSFVPIINECSREICKMKSYASFLSEFEDINDKYQQKEKVKEIQYKPMSRQNTVKKSKGKPQCTFQPQISQNTKKLTKNLPNFYDRLEMSKEKKKVKQLQHFQPNNAKLVERPQRANKINKITLKKQIYTIDDEELSDQLQTQKKAKNKHTKDITLGSSQQIQYKGKVGLDDRDWEQIITEESGQQARKKEKCEEKRSQLLFNNRKKSILQRIVAFFTAKPYMTADEFSRGQKKTKRIDEDTQIDAFGIEENPHIPNFVKQLLNPITSELIDAEISLTKKEFVWALEKLFAGLSVSDKGTLLGWGVKLLPQ